MSAVISVRGLSKAYRLGSLDRNAAFQDIKGLFGGGSPEGSDPNLFWALKNVSFDVEKGTVLGLVGKNGAGKSTLLKILSRITTPTKGEVRIKGNMASLLEVGTGFHPELSGRDNIFLNGAILGMSKKEVAAKFDQIVDFSGVEKFIDTPVKRYSSGMYVRLAFAVAAHLEPEILIVDEVLAVGDAEFQAKCMGAMKEVSSQGRTVVFVSHNMRSIASLCTSAVLLEHGGVTMMGDTEEVITRYLGTDQISQSKSLHIGTDKDSAEGISLRSVRILSQPPFRTSEPIIIEIELSSLVEMEFHANINIKTNDDILILQSGSTPFMTKKGGDYRIRYTMPGNILNEGDYRVNISFVEKRQRVFNRVFNVLSFTTTESLEHNELKWYGRSPGLIKIPLESTVTES